MHHRELLDRAIYLASKSGVKSFKTGAVIASKRGTVSEGWSHYSSLRLTRYRSIHAELHAILRARKADTRGTTIYVATIRSKSGNIGLAKPCPFCQELLYEAGIWRAYFTVDGADFSHLDIGQ